MRVAVYPGKFDPVTNGHLDIVKRAAATFDQVIVAVYDLKGSMFSTAERVALFTEAIRPFPNARATSFSGLVIDFAREMSAGFLVRGIRAVTGFEAEFDMALMNRKMAPEIESLYLIASLENLFISGTRIREVAALGYDVSELVPAHVAAALKKKFAPA